MPSSKHQLAKAAADATLEQRISGGRLPRDFLEKARKRLGAVCLIYAITFFFANFFMVIVLGQFRELMPHFSDWGPGFIARSTVD